MAILSLKSTNPQFSFVLQKNPASGMLIKTMRQGKVFGWFFDENTYNIYFKDGEDEVSYKKHPDESFEYINVSRYNSSLFVNNAIKLFFNALTNKNPDDPKNWEQYDKPGYVHTAYINMVRIRSPKVLDMFLVHYPDMIQCQEVTSDSYSLTITSNESVYHLINFLNLFAIFIAIYNNEYIYLEKALVDKYISALNDIEAPYFIRYLFKLKLLRGAKSFEQYKELLEKSSTDDIVMKFGSNHHIRRAEIQSHLSFDNPIIDVGCGEGYYVKSFAKRLAKNNAEYIAIDPDKKMREIVERIAKRRSLEDNVVISESFEQCKEQLSDERTYDVIITEVIEHLPLEQAKKLIKDILNTENINKVIITTPNKDFNQFYYDDEETLRHDDHQWEMTGKQFREWIESLLDKNYKHEYMEIGDRVNGICVSLGVVLQNQNTLVHENT